MRDLSQVNATLATLNIGSTKIVDIRPLAEALKVSRSSVLEIILRWSCFGGLVLVFLWAGVGVAIRVDCHVTRSGK